MTPEACAAGQDETKGHDLPDGARYGCGVKSDGRSAIVKPGSSLVGEWPLLVAFGYCSSRFYIYSQRRNLLKLDEVENKLLSCELRHPLCTVSFAKVRYETRA